MNSGFGVWIAGDADSLAGSFARAGVGLRSLAAHRQSAQVAHPAITFNRLQPLEVHADFAAQITLNNILAVLNRMHDLRKLLFGQILRANARIDFSVRQDIDGVAGADAVN